MARAARIVTNQQKAFLDRFVGRGWLAAVRDDPFEQAAVDAGLRAGWLRRELSEAHFTIKGRQQLDPG